MPLPKIDTPTYETKQPSTKKVVKFRPFTVKEQKILLIANEEKNSMSFLKATMQIIENCTFGKLTSDNTTTADVEYLFLKIRAKSVGESSEILVTCPHCGEKVPLVVNIDKVEFTALKELPDEIDLGNKVGVKLKKIFVKDILDLQDASGNIDDFELIIRSIVSIYDSENVYDTTMVSKKELVEFLDSMTGPQFAKIQEFLSNKQEVFYKVSMKCPKCGKDFELTLSGLADFF